MRNLYTPLKISFLLIICLSRFVETRAQDPVLVYQPVVTGLSSPVDAVTAPGDGRMFIAQQNGQIRIRNGASLTTFANLAGVITTTGNEQGLLSLAFHPQYATNRYLFVLYTAAGTEAITLARYMRDAVDPNAIDAASGTVLLSIAKPTPITSYRNHNGGKIIFGTDGYLYMSTGDGGSGGDPGNRAQDRTQLLGKMLRLDVNSFATSAPFYDIPPTNPYASPIDGFRDEIYAYGLRNPWRWSFDRATGDMWIGDVGQSSWEEVNWVRAGEAIGGNFGWRCYEGAHLYGPGGCAPLDTISPIFEYDRNFTTGGVSITGGIVYRGAASPALQGFYVVADYVSGNVWKIRPNGSGGWQTFIQNGLSANVAGFAEGPTGELYAINRGGGRLDSISVASTVPVNIRYFTVTAQNGYNDVNWTTAAEINTSRFYIEYGTDGASFTRVGNVPAAGNGSGRSYTYRHNISQQGFVYYRLATEDADGSVSYSNIVRIRSGNAIPIKVYPTISSGGQLTIEVNKPIQELQLINTGGAIVFRKNMQGLSGTLPLLLPALPKGVYVLRAGGPTIDFREKIILR